MTPRTLPIRSKLPDTGVTIFTTMSRLALEHGAINLSQGFPDFNCAPELIDAVTRYMREGHNQYAPMPGTIPLREALAMKIERLYGRRYDPVTEITVTSGATEALFASLTALVHPGDDVLLFQPAYDSYVPAIQLSGGTPVFVTLRPPDYHIDWEAARRALTPRTRVIVLNSPHNPTGMILTADDMRELQRLLEQTDAFVISDEAYEHIVFDGARHESMSRYPAIAERAIVIGSFAKTFHTTGWKIGWTAAPKALSGEVQSIHQWVTFAVNGAIQMAFAEMLRNDPECRGVGVFYQRKRDLFLSLIKDSRFRPLPCRGTFFQMMDYSAISSDRDTEVAMWLLEEHGVASIPPSSFLYGVDAGPILRFCFGKQDETLERAAERLRKV
ncbi:MAG: methionine aminotransferase [Acidobacteria bacterium]|nr:MAG: methionine aminotransferase [Acidobacteriota bacterium]